MDTFSADNPPHMELTLRDESGVGQVSAVFNHQEESDSYIVLAGDGAGQTEARVQLDVSTFSGHLPAGDYRCTRVQASDVSGNSNTFTPETHPTLSDKTFRYVYQSAQSDDKEGPELIG